MAPLHHTFLKYENNICLDHYSLPSNMHLFSGMVPQKQSPHADIGYDHGSHQIAKNSKNHQIFLTLVQILPNPQKIH